MFTKISVKRAFCDQTAQEEKELQATFGRYEAFSQILTTPFDFTPKKEGNAKGAV
jgi:hypothetical protein